MSSTIKIGDMVIRKAQLRDGVFKKFAGPYRVTNVYRGPFETNITIDPAGHELPADGWHARYFDVVPQDKGEWIIILKENGKYSPASTPRVYTTETQAKAVAASMAEKHPGKDFVILKAVGKAKTTAATVEMF